MKPPTLSSGNALTDGLRYQPVSCGKSVGPIGAICPRGFFGSGVPVVIDGDEIRLYGLRLPIDNRVPRVWASCLHVVGHRSRVVIRGKADAPGIYDPGSAGKSNDARDVRVPAEHQRGLNRAEFLLDLTGR